MAHSAQAFSVDDSDGRGGIAAEVQPDVVEAEIREYGLEAKQLSCAFAHSGELRLARRQGDGRLGLGPGFEAHLAPLDDTGACGFSRGDTSCEIPIHVGSEVCRSLVPREFEHQPGLAAEVAHCSFQPQFVSFSGLGEMPHQFLRGKLQIGAVQCEVVENGRARSEEHDRFSFEQRAILFTRTRLGLGH